jgi:hypothetical protein
MRLAFKNGLIAAQHEDQLGAFFSTSIVKVTGGKYSHVEVVLTGELSSATTFAAIEPIGCRYATIDLTQPAGLWTVLETPSTQQQIDFINAFCAGSDGKPYDSMGIVGIGAENGVHDPRDRFCSELAVELCQKAQGLFPNFLRWMVAPSGPTTGKRFGR